MLALKQSAAKVDLLAPGESRPTATTPPPWLQYGPGLFPSQKMYSVICLSRHCYFMLHFYFDASLYF